MARGVRRPRPPRRRRYTPETEAFPPALPRCRESSTYWLRGHVQPPQGLLRAKMI